MIELSTILNPVVMPNVFFHATLEMSTDRMLNPASFCVRIRDLKLIPSITVANSFFTTRYSDVNYVLSTNKRETVMIGNRFPKI